DLPWLSLSFGLLVEGAWHEQGFTAGSRTAPSRSAVGLAFAGLFAVERHLWKGLAVRGEGGPVALLFPRGVVQGGAGVGAELGSAFTWWLAAGPVWRL